VGSETKVPHKQAGKPIGKIPVSMMVKIETNLRDSRDPVHLGRSTLKEAWCVTD